MRTGAIFIANFEKNLLALQRSIVSQWENGLITVLEEFDLTALQKSIHEQY